MRTIYRHRAWLASIAAGSLLLAQQPPAPAPAAPAPGQAAPAPAAPAQPAPAQTAPAQPAPAAAPIAASGGFQLNNVSLVDFIDIVARRLQLNYILDPAVKGVVSVNTYGEVRITDLRSFLDTVLRINGFAMVQAGNIWRVVPLKSVAQMPLQPLVNSENLPEGEGMVLNLIFLKYATVAEISKLVQPFLGEGAAISVYEPANLLLLLDNARSMKRTMDLISLFDSDNFAGQRVRLFETEHGRPGDLAKELEQVFKSLSLSEKAASVRFMPIDRINTIIALAPNPGIFAEVEKWLKKLDIPVKSTAGATDNFVYRLRYQRAETVAFAVMQLYGMPPWAMMGMGMMGGMGMGGMGMGGMGMGYNPYGNQFGGAPGAVSLPGSPGMVPSGFGMGAMGMGGMGMYGMGMPGMYGMGMGMPQMGAAGQPAATGATGSASVSGNAAIGGAADMTGQYLGAMGGYGGMWNRTPRIIPNPFDNTLLIQGTPQEWDQIQRLLERIDIAPRQVLVEAKIYEVTLTGAFSAGVQAYLNRRGTRPQGHQGRALFGQNTAAGTTLTAGLLAGQSRELLAVLTANENTTKVRIVQAPQVIATDSIQASINIGQEVPTLASQAVSPIQSGGNSLFTNTITNRNTGVTMNITARINPSGIVTLQINQEISAPQAPEAGSIQSPSFSKRQIQTQVTVEDGETVAIGGIMLESNTSSSAGTPILHRIPVIGTAFGAKSNDRSRSELIVFFTPRVIYDTNQLTDATDQLKNSLKRLRNVDPTQYKLP